MRRTTRTAAVLALGFVALGAGDAAAAWNNVFQTTCCGGRSSSSSYFAPAPAACPPTVSYVQRSYYQPVTSYKTESYYEPVTTYQTSNYWEPVTRYRYTSYYDPCTGCAQNVATPYTSYYMRSKCNAVQSYVQRCRMVPVTEYRKSYYMEPVVTYSAPACCDSAPPIGSPPAGISESAGPGGAGLSETNEPPVKRIPRTNIPESFSRPGSAPAAKPIRADRIAGLTEGGRLQGQVVRDDRISPRANATLLFVGDGKGQEVSAKTDPAGRFAVALPAGEWTLFVPGPEGKPVFHSQVLVRHADDRLVTVVSR